jgi:hypothetical protein
MFKGGEGKKKSYFNENCFRDNSPIDVTKFGMPSLGEKCEYTIMPNHLARKEN